MPRGDTDIHGSEKINVLFIFNRYYVMFLFKQPNAIIFFSVSTIKITDIISSVNKWDD
jgi:hypothetical protein